MSFEELPDLLTIEEAGDFLRIGRGLAYQLARQHVASGGTEGLPVVQLGRRRLVPKRQIERILNGELSIVAAPPAPPTPSQRTKRVQATAKSTAQLSLLSHEN